MYYWLLGAGISTFVLIYWIYVKWEEYNNFFIIIKEYWLEALLFLVALGNAELWRFYLVSTGSVNSWQLTMAVYATELVIVSAGMWGITGLVIAFVMFLTSLVAIYKLFPTNFEWVAHSYFSITIFFGTVGNYVRRGGLLPAWNKAKKNYIKKQQITLEDEIKKLSHNAIRQRWRLSHNNARKVKAMALAGELITEDMLVALQKA